VSSDPGCLWFRVRCGRFHGRHREESVDSLATCNKSDCHLRSLYAPPSIHDSTTSCLQLHHHHHHQHNHHHPQQVADHRCSASPHHDQLTHCQPASCLYSRRLCRHGDASICRCIYSSTDDDDEDSDTARQRRRVKPLLSVAAGDTDTQTDDRPPDDFDHSSPDCPRPTHRLLMTSSHQLPVTSDVITMCGAAELIVAWVGGATANTPLCPPKRCH